jgi:Zn-dependent alcohol dehydrogenase
MSSFPVDTARSVKGNSAAGRLVVAFECPGAGRLEMPEMLGPLGCGLQTGAGAAPNVMQPAAGQSIAVYGAGEVGLAGLVAARIAGCDPIIAVDRLPDRLALARDLGATHTLESRGAETLAEIPQRQRRGTVRR